MDKNKKKKILAVVIILAVLTAAGIYLFPLLRKKNLKSSREYTPVYKPASVNPMSGVVSSIKNSVGNEAY